MNKILLSLISLCISISCLCQHKLVFPQNPTIIHGKDTTLYVLNSTKIYNYFTQDYDSLIVFNSQPSHFHQIASISNKNNRGYLKIMYSDRIVFKFEIREGEIEGIGTRYDFFDGSIGYQSMFKNGQLDGVTIFFNSNGSIYSIAQYKKGRFKKYFYHQTAKTRKSLRRGNRKSNDPFKKLLIKM